MSLRYYTPAMMLIGFVFFLWFQSPPQATWDDIQPDFSKLTFSMPKISWDKFAFLRREKADRVADLNAIEPAAGAALVKKAPVDPIAELTVKAEAGDLESIVRLTQFYEAKGEMDAFSKWAMKAYDAGRTDFSRSLAVLAWDDSRWADAILWAHRAETNDVKGSALLLGILYSRLDNPMRNDQKAVNWLKKAQKMGDHEAPKFLFDVVTRK